MSPIREMIKTCEQKQELRGTGRQRHLTSCERAHQRVEHQRVIRVLLRRLYHDVEQRVQSVLQELGSDAKPPQRR